MSESLRGEILSIGDELLYGDIVDTNKVFIAQHMRLCGVQVRHFQTVGDELDEMVAAFKLALSRAQIIITTGGLGPTQDDMSLAAAAAALGVELEYRDEILEQMARRLNRKKEDFGGSNTRQCWVPAGSVTEPNHWGTAPFVRFSDGDRHLFMMPGVPREMKGMFETYVLPFVKEHSPSKEVLSVKHINVVGIGESRIGEAMHVYMQPGHNPDVGTCVNDGVCRIRIVGRAADEASARALMQEAIDHATTFFGHAVFGEDEEDLADAAAKALMENKKTIALAESCTAGLIAATLAKAPGISASLMEGAVTYANEAKIRALGVNEATLQAHGAVSEQTAREMAEGMRARAGTDVALSITGIAGPDGGTDEKPMGLMFIGLATAEGTQVFRREVRGMDRQAIRTRAVTHALDLIRRAALGVPLT